MPHSHYREMGADSLATALRIRARFNAQRTAQAREDALRAKARLLLNLGGMIICEDALQDDEFIVSSRLYGVMKVLMAEDEAAKKRADETLVSREREFGGDSGTAMREGLPNIQTSKAVSGQPDVAGEQLPNGG